jgi:outer membrane protein assembly factor BamA
MAVVAPLAWSQLDEPLKQCLPWPTFSEELQQMGIETKVNIVVTRIQFVGARRLSKAIQRQIATSLEKSQFTATPDSVTDWAGELGERVRQAWQKQGFFKAQVVRVETQLIREQPGQQSFAVVVHVEEGRQYRLLDLQFKNNKVLPTEYLQSLFPLRPGDVFDTDQIRRGLDNIRRTYDNAGHVDGVAVPDTKVDDANGTISVAVDLDDGPLFHLGQVKILGLNQQTATGLLRRWDLKAGEPYNSGLIVRFYKANADGFGDVADSHVQQHIDVNSPEHLIGLTIDFRRFQCPWTM